MNGSITSTGIGLTAHTMEKNHGVILRAEQTPYPEEVQEPNWPAKEPLQEQNYRLELELRRLKRSL